MIKFWVIVSIVLTLLSGIAIWNYASEIGIGDVDAKERCLPYDVRTDVLSTQDVEITWKTHDICQNYVKVGETDDDLETVLMDSYNKSVEHKVVVPTTNRNRQFYFVIVSDGKVYGADNKPILFTGDSF